MGSGRIHSGQVAGEYFKDGMVVSFDRPCPTIERDDTLAIRAPNGEMLEIFPAAKRSDGAVSVWYAPHPLLRHWLGWMERIDDLRWSFRMEPHHIDTLRGIPELCGDADR
jgi:hypothetical protein